MRELRPGPVTLPASWLYCLGAGLHHRLWDQGIRRPKRLPGTVLSVGNLTAGGTGKTPAVLALARAAAEAGWNPAVLTRGYGGTSRGVLRDGTWTGGTSRNLAETGDEALLLSRSLPQVPVVVNPRRHAGARALLDAGETPDLWILDDGFQHRALARDADLVLLDAGEPLGNGRFLPAGPLREPASALARATAILLTGSRPEAPPGDAVARLLAGMPRPVPVWRSWVELASLAWLGPGPRIPVPEPAGHPALAVSGMARPERFHALLRRSGFAIREVRIFRDHHRFTASEIEGLERRARETGAVLVTTAKDAVRLEDRIAPGAPWLVVGIRVESDPGWGALLAALVGKSPGGGAGRVPLASPASLG